MSHWKCENVEKTLWWVEVQNKSYQFNWTCFVRFEYILDSINLFNSSWVRHFREEVIFDSVDLKK